MEGNAIAVMPGDDGDGHELTVYVSTQMPHLFQQLAAPTARPAGGGDPRHHPPRRRRLRRQGGRHGRARRGHGGGPPARPAGDVGRDPLGEPGGHAPRAGPGAVRRDGLHPRRHHHRDARCRIVGDAGAYGGFGGGLAMGPTRTMAQGVYRIPKIAYDVAVAVTNTTPDGRVPRRRPARSGGVPRADHGHGRRRARHRPGRDPPAQPARARRVPLHHADGHHLRHRRLRAPARPGRRARRLRRRCWPSRPRDASGATGGSSGIGVSTYVEVTAGGGASEYGVGRGPRRRHAPRSASAPRPTARVTPPRSP